MQGQGLTSSIRTAFEHFTKRAANGFIIPEWLPTPANQVYLAAVRQLDDYVYELIRSRKAALASSPTNAAPQSKSDLQQGSSRLNASTPPAGVKSSTTSDLLTALVTARDEDGSAMPNQNIRDELMTLLVAGQETSAIVLAWLCAALAWHPHVQEQAAAEVAVRIVRDSSNPIKLPSVPLTLSQSWPWRHAHL